MLKSIISVTTLLSLTELVCAGTIIYIFYTSFLMQSVDLEVAMSSRMQLNLMQECGTIFCLDKLSEEENIQFQSCYNRTSSKKMVKKFGPIITGKCRFQDGSARYPVALGSFQGSGNTWLRGLLETVTGICTGKFVVKCLHLYSRWQTLS